jgi:DMSO/TMAO reductase YedYZ heme-binding membrane subunit
VACHVDTGNQTWLLTAEPSLEPHVWILLHLILYLRIDLVLNFLQRSRIL